MTKWEHLRAVIQEMAGKGMSDVEIGTALNLKNPHYVRSSLGIPAGRLPGGWKGMWSEPDEPEPVLQPECVYEENGITVKRYPTRWLEGAGSGVTARPRR